MISKAKTSEKLDFEAAIEQLEKIVEKLESGELSLEESIEAFEQGIELSKLCRKKLEKAEDRVRKLLETTEGKVDLELFEEDEGKKDE